MGNINAQMNAGIMQGARVTQGENSLVLLFNLIDYPAGKEMWVWTVLGRFGHRRNLARDFIVELAKGLGCRFISGQAELTAVKNLWKAQAPEVATVYRMDLTK